MIATAAAMGMAPSEFWSLSEPEITLWLRGARQRQDELYELGMYIAWHLACWSRGKIPSWESVQKKLKPSKPEEQTQQPWQAMKGIMAARRIALATPAKPKPKSVRSK